MKTFKILFNYIQIPVKLLLVVMMIFGSYEYLNKVFINKEISYGEDFQSLPNDSLDVLVLGSSDAQYSFVPSFFYKDTGLYSYVRGTACQPLEVSYEMLKESLKTQSPKLLMLEVFTAMPLRSICEDDSCYVIAQYQMSGQEKINTINYLPEEKVKEYKNDFINYHNDWRTRTDYESLLPSNVFSNKHTLDSYFGYVYQYGDTTLPDNYWPPQTYEEDLNVELDPLDLESLNNIYDLCENNNIQLLLYKTPIDGITQEDQSALHKVWEWANEKGIKYLDFVSLAEDLNFFMRIHSDAFHCNVNGASMLSKYIANFVNDNYDFNHTQNNILDQLYKKEVWWLSKDAIDTENSPSIYLQRLKNTEGIVCLRYNPHKDKKIGEGLYNLICDMGCSYFDINYSYYAIIKDGELLQDGYSPIEYDYEGTKIVIRDDIVSVGLSSYNTKGPISIVFSNKDEIESGIIKNIDYIPFPWDVDSEYYH